MKPFWKSKTLWINVLTGATVLLGKGDVIPLDADSAALALAAANVVLRVLTKDKLTTKKPGRR